MCRSSSFWGDSRRPTTNIDRVLCVRAPYQRQQKKKKNPPSLKFWVLQSVEEENEAVPPTNRASGNSSWWKSANFRNSLTVCRVLVFFGVAATGDYCSKLKWETWTDFFWHCEEVRCKCASKGEVKTREEENEAEAEKNCISSRVCLLPSGTFYWTSPFKAWCWNVLRRRIYTQWNTESVRTNESWENENRS